MRNILLILFLSAITISTVAQKGSTLLYGNFTYQYLENHIYGSGQGSNLSINPGIGYGLSNQWTAGLNLAFGLFKNNSEEAYTYGAGPFIRYTHPLSEIFSVFAQFETLYAIEESQSGYESKKLYAGLFPAVEMNIKNGFALNLGFGGIGFTRFITTGVPGNTNTLGVQFGSGMNFGVSKRFGRK
jgi:hypothetical protein